MITASLGWTQIVFNEFMSNNESSIFDEDGEFTDWVEIYNLGPTSINLNGYGLSDKEDNPYKWVFPNKIIDPGDFLIIFASEKDRYGGELHTNFKISSDGEGLYLFHPDDGLLDYVPPTPLSEDISFGRMPNGTGKWERIFQPNPGHSNHLASAIQFDYHSGFYAEPITMGLVSTNGHQIKYTLDGSEPNESSSLFVAAITFGELAMTPDDISFIPTSPHWATPAEDNYKAHILRAATFDGGVRTSKIYTKVIFIQPDLNERYAEYDLVSIVASPGSLFDEDTGIYVPGVHFNPMSPTWSGNYFKRGEAWERHANLQYFTSDGNLAFEQEIGIRTHGGKGRNFPQKSLRFYSRGERGAPKLNYPFFEHLGEEKRVYDKVVLRNSLTCWNNSMIKDEVTAQVCDGLKIETQHAKPVVVFVNGEYWGLQSIREYYDQKYFSERYNVDEDSVNIVLHGSSNHPDFGDDWGIVEGSNDGHITLYDFLNENNLDVPENYEFVKNLLDIESIIDYYCTEIYFNNKDWPTNNNKLWSEGSFGKWRQMLYDIDGGWKYLGTGYNQLARALSPSGSGQNAPYATLLLRKLFQSDEFKTAFLERMACLMKTNFDAENVVNIINYYRGLYEPGVYEHIDRWKKPSSYSSWNSGVNGLIDFANGRKAHVINHIQEEFGITFDPDEYICPVIIDDATIEENSQDLIINVYPNPTSSNSVFVDFETPTTEFEYQLFSLSGRLLQSGILQKNEALDLNFASGTYLLSIVTDGNQHTKRVIVL